MKSGSRWTLCVLVLLTASACTDAVPTSSDRDRIPIDAQTIEVRLPFSAFAKDFRTYSGFGSAGDLASPVLAHEWGGDFESRVLLKFGPLPDAIVVRPPDGGATQDDSAYVPVSGTVVLRFDTIQVLGPSSFRMTLGAIEDPWDPDTATWDLAADTLGGVIPWPEPGAGPVRPLGEAVWKPFVADTLTVDSVGIDVDSLTVTEWSEYERGDTGLRIVGTTSSSRIRLIGADLRVIARSSINPDTTVEVSSQGGQATFVYSPSAVESPGVFQIGGVPARRAVFEVALPEALELTGDVCARLECPVRLEPNRIVYAGLGLRTHTNVSPGLAPLDSLAVEVRAVLSPERLPRSPLGAPVHSQLDGLAPVVFSGQTETLIEIGMTNYLQNLLDPDTNAGGGTSPVLAIVSDPEPADIALAPFWAPGTEFEPTLRLILTVSDEVPLP